MKGFLSIAAFLLFSYPPNLAFCQQASNLHPIVQFSEQTDCYGMVIGYSSPIVYFISIQYKEEASTIPLLNKEKVIGLNMKRPADANKIATLPVNDQYVIHLYQYSDNSFDPAWLPYYYSNLPNKEEKLNFVSDLLESKEKILTQLKEDCLQFAEVMPNDSSLWVLEGNGYPWKRSMPVYNTDGHLVGLIANPKRPQDRNPIVISISRLQNILYDYGFNYRNKEKYSECYFFTLKYCLQPFLTSCELAKMNDDLKVKEEQDAILREKQEKERIAQELKEMSNTKRRHLRNSRPNLFTQSILAEYRFLRGPGSTNTFWEIGTDIKVIPDRWLSFPIEFKFGGFMQKLDSAGLADLSPYENITFYKTSSRTLRLGGGLEMGRAQFLALKGGVMKNIVSKTYYETFGKRIVETNPNEMWQYVQIMYGYKDAAVSFSFGLEYFFELPLEMRIASNAMDPTISYYTKNPLDRRDRRWSFNFQMAVRLFGGYGNYYKRTEYDYYNKY